MKTCDITDCDKPARSNIAELCKMHYHRRYRHGSTDKVATGISTGTPRLYRRLYVPGHPLATTRGVVYAHRYYLYEAIGPGPHNCYWCRTEVRWKVGQGGTDNLQVDHLNGTKDDNRSENLVPACPSCNTRRGLRDRSDKLKAQGFFSVNDTVDRLTRQRRMDRLG